MTASMHLLRDALYRVYPAGMRFSLTWTMPARLERVGRHTSLPGAFTARWEFDEDHTVEMDVVATGGQPVCDAIRVLRNPARPPLSGTELRRIPVGTWLTFACAQAALRIEGDGVVAPVATDDQADVAAHEIERRVKRRRVTEDLLRDVAATYVAAEGDAQVVAETFYVSLSQAFRYIKKAREAGLIPEEA